LNPRTYEVFLRSNLGSAITEKCSKKEPWGKFN
jgi:hypothetical protein